MKYLIAFNFLAIIIVGVVFVAPVFISFHKARVNRNILEKKYHAAQGIIDNYNKDSQELENSNSQNFSLIFLLSEALAGAEYGLQENVFSVSEIMPVQGEIYEMRVQVELAGEISQALAYLYDFSGGKAAVDSFSISQTGENALLKLDFSLFGLA
ncbi:MAG: hypothetical protein FWG87_03305 [Defluviitaleaceae bacterium]|nr:hypothetical protein [Defluviitaleaceae bacterium]